MSRWSEQLDKHPIHQTLQQITDWLDVDVTEFDENGLKEINRIKKVVEVLRVSLAGMDASLLPFNRLDGVNNNLRHQNIWNQLNSFHSNKNIQHVTNANNHLTNVIDQIYWVISSSQDGATEGVISHLESFAVNTTIDLTEKENLLSKEIEELKTEVKSLNDKKDELENLIEKRKQDVDQQTSQWQQQFSDAQDKRSTDFSEWKKQIDSEVKEQSKTITSGTQEAINKYKQGIEDLLNGIKEDAEAKHKAIRELYELSSGDSISGGYAQVANDEEGYAKLWRRISLGFIIVTAIWIVVSYFGCDGFCPKNEEPNVCEQCVERNIPVIADKPEEKVVEKGSKGVDVNKKKEGSKEKLDVGKEVSEEKLSKAKKIDTKADNSKSSMDNKPAEKFSWRKFLLNFSLIGVLLFGAGFSSKQSTLHRNEAVRTRRFAVQVNALDPYINSFDKADQVELKKQLAEKFFTGIDPTEVQHDMISESALQTMTKAITDVIKAKVG